MPLVIYMKNPIQKEKFDLVVSLGENCGCAGYLNTAHLRTASYPFDWLTGCPFERRIDLIINHFDGFLEKENLIPIDESALYRTDEKHKAYSDEATGFQILHDFPRDASFDEGYALARERYNRRIERLYTETRLARKALYVWWDKENTLTAAQIMDAREKLSRFFEKEIYMLVLQHDANAASSACEEILSAHVVRYVVDMKIDLESRPFGDKKATLRIFSKVRCKGKTINNMKKAFVQLVCSFVPGKARRAKVRDALRRWIRYGQYSVH